MRVDKTAHTPLRRITVQVNATTPLPCVEVSAHGPDLTSRAGTVLLSGLADRLGLTEGLTAALHVHSRKVRHEPGRVVRDLAVLLADGGDCLSDLGALRDQQALFGPVASDATAYRCLERLDEAALARIRAARARGQAGHVADDFHVRKRRCSVHLHGDPPERGLRVLTNSIIPAREDL